MTDTVYLLDHENQAKADLSGLGECDRVILFLGETSSVNRDLFNTSMKLGVDRVSIVNIAGTGKNALDFHLAFYLGEILTKAPAARCVIVSKDKGFAPLVKHLKARQFRAEQMDTVPVVPTVRATTAKPAALLEDGLFNRARDSLARGDKKARPRKRSTLQKHLKHILNGKATDEQMDQVLDRLIRENIVLAAGDSISYPD